MKLKHLSIAVALAATSASSFAGAPNFIDARAAAMGGVGVVTARPRAASFFNPALLAVKQPEKSDSFGMLTPSVMAFADDEDELSEAVDDFEDDFLDPFENSIDALQAAIPTAVDENDLADELAAVESSVNALDGELTRINNDQAMVDVGAGISFAIPGQSFAMALFASGSARINASVQYRDSAFLQGTFADAEDAVNAMDPDAISYDPNDDANNLQSSVRGIGTATAQGGVSMASSFNIAGRDMAIGLSPKMVDFRVYDYSADVDDFDEDDLEDREKSDTSINLDLGMATWLDQQKSWMVGLSVLNMLSRDLKTDGDHINGNGTNPAGFDIAGISMELQPTITTGISYSTESFVVAADLQLNETDGFHTVDGIQMAGLGMEYDLGSFVQFRVGARHNLAGDGDPILTGGLGLDIFGATVELAGMGNSNAMGAALQVGAMF